MEIDIRKILLKYGLDRKQLAVELFPETKFPDRAFNRIYNGDSLLDSEQLSRLASLAGVSVNDLYARNWSVKTKPGNLIIFEKDDYRAELDRQSWITKVYHKGSIFHEEVLSSEVVTLKVYLSGLDKIVANK